MFDELPDGRDVLTTDGRTLDRLNAAGFHQAVRNAVHPTKQRPQRPDIGARDQADGQGRPFGMCDGPGFGCHLTDDQMQKGDDEERQAESRAAGSPVRQTPGGEHRAEPGVDGRLW